MCTVIYVTTRWQHDTKLKLSRLYTLECIGSHTHKLHNHPKHDFIPFIQLKNVWHPILFICTEFVVFMLVLVLKLYTNPFSSFGYNEYKHKYAVYDCKHRLSCFHGVKGHISNLCPIRKM